MLYPVLSKPTLDVEITVALWTELFIYAIYSTLFIDAMFILRSKKMTGAQSGTLVFLYTAVLMYVLATIHIGLALFRYMDTYILVSDPQSRGFELFNFKRWDTILTFAIFSAMTWLGDALVIYRCYFVWNKDFRVVLLPILLLVTFIGLGLFVAIDTSRPGRTGAVPSGDAPMDASRTMYPLAVAQNVLTTGLIAFKIWQQHRLSASHGIVDRGSPLSLLRILRIIIESAMIYTLQVIVYMILFFCQSPAQIILQNMMVPSLGVVFVLMSLRIHHAKESTGGRAYNSSLPRWLDNTTSGINFSDQRSQPPVGLVSLRVSGESLHDRNDIALEPIPSAPNFHEKKNSGHGHDL